MCALKTKEIIEHLSDKKVKIHNQEESSVGENNLSMK